MAKVMIEIVDGEDGAVSMTLTSERRLRLSTEMMLDPRARRN